MSDSAEPPAPPASNGEVAAASMVRRTFVFTDVEGSTSLWEKAGRPFRRALEQHDTLIRAEIERNSGQELTETGDGFLIAFADAETAAACAVAIQRQLELAQWPDSVGRLRARIGLHSGDVDSRGEEYRGIVLNRAARVLSAGHGGQIVCSSATAAELAGRWELLLLGVFRLRGLATPERLFQLCWPGMPQREFPPLTALPAFNSNLPRALTRFFGRMAEIDKLREELLAGSATGEGLLLTLTGPGGTGKTRLSLALAESVLTAFSHAVWFVPLADVSDPALVLLAIRDALQIPASSANPLEQIAALFGSEPALLVLDNFEQLGQEGAGAVSALLRRLPQLRCIVTSRQRLELEGEREIAVPPLPVPATRSTPEELVNFASVQLFVDRAQAVRSGFELTEVNRASVAELCRRLEGVPLAIALAAARANVSTPREILDSLAKRLDFSATAGEPVPDRHRTLRAAIEWSYDFLPPALQQFFANLGVFRGGFTAEAAAVVAAPDDLAGVSGSVKRALAELRSGSLITAFEAGECMRYRMLETLRCYAEEQLSASGSAVEVQARHGAYFCGLAMEAESRLQGADQPQALNSLELEQENLRAALDSPQPVELRLQMAVALATFWRVRGYAREAQGWIARLRAEAGDTPAAAGAANAEGILAWSAADLPAARAAFEITLQHFRESGDLRNVAGVLSNLAMVASASGDLQLAREHAEESVRLYRGLSLEAQKAQALSNLAGIALAQNDTRSARAAIEEALPIQRQFGDQQSLANSLHNLASGFLDEGKPEESRRAVEESLALRRQLRDRANAANSFYVCARLALQSQLHAEAVRWLSASEEAAAEFATPLFDRTRAVQREEIRRLRGLLPTATFDEEWRAGALLVHEWFGEAAGGAG